MGLKTVSSSGGSTGKFSRGFPKAVGTSGSSPPSTSSYVAEDGVSPYVAENGTDFYVTESGGGGLTGQSIGLLLALTYA